MNTKQASLLLEQAIDICQSPEPACPAVEDLEIVAGLLVSFRDGWFAERRLASERRGPKVPAVPAPPTDCERIVGRTHRPGILGPVLIDRVTVKD
jgi:hypothetical protein